jgi:hypothetical protein
MWISIEAQVALNRGDEDWEELVNTEPCGCSRKPTMEVERSHYEAEPNIDKFTPDQIHNLRNLQH